MILFGTQNLWAGEPIEVRRIEDKNGVLFMACQNQGCRVLAGGSFTHDEIEMMKDRLLAKYRFDRRQAGAIGAAATVINPVGLIAILMGGPLGLAPVVVGAAVNYYIFSSLAEAGQKADPNYQRIDSLVQQLEKRASIDKNIEYFEQNLMQLRVEINTELDLSTDNMIYYP